MDDKSGNGAGTERENPEGTPPEAVPPKTDAPATGRRRLIVGSLLASPIVLTLGSRFALANGTQQHKSSGIHSAAWLKSHPSKH